MLLHLSLLPASIIQNGLTLSDVLDRATVLFWRAVSWLTAIGFFNAAAHALLWVMYPGLLVCSELGIDPFAHGPYLLLAVFLLSWFMWVRAARILYCIVARSFGFYDPQHFLSFTKFWLPWRKPYQGLMVLVRLWRQITEGGTGANRRWTGFLETCTYLFDPSKDCLAVGRLWFHRLGLFQTIGIPGGERHVFFCAAPGAGKTTQIMTMLGCLDPSAAAFVVDCDGAMVNALGPALEQAGHNVVKLDPDNIAKGFTKAGRWNPMDELTRADDRHGRASVVAFASILGNALIVQDSATQPVFSDTARVFLRSLILYVWLVEKEKTLMRLRELLTRGLPEKLEDPLEDPFDRLLFEMNDLSDQFKEGTFDDGCKGEICDVIANGAGVMRGSTREGKGNPFLSTAIYQTAWLDDTAVRPLLQSSDINGEDLKLGNPVVFMVATLTDVQTRLAPWFRAFTLMTLYAFQRARPDMKVKHPCLFVLDEFPSLGRMESVATAAPGFRKYGVRLVTVTQSLQRLQKTYPQEWRDFLGAAQACIWMGLDDPDTLKFLSEEMLGQCLRKEKIDGYHWVLRLMVRPFGVVLPPARYQMVPRMLMDPQQCRAFLDPTTWQIIVTRFGRNPMRLKRLAYFKELPVWKYAANPSFGESPLRSITRESLMRWSEAMAWTDSFFANHRDELKADLKRIATNFGYAIGIFFFVSIMCEDTGWPLPARVVFGIPATLCAAFLLRNHVKTPAPYRGCTMAVLSVYPAVLMFFLLGYAVAPFDHSTVTFAPLNWALQLVSFALYMPMLALIAVIAGRASARETQGAHAIAFMWTFAMYIAIVACFLPLLSAAFLLSGPVLYYVLIPVKWGVKKAGAFALAALPHQSALAVKLLAVTRWLGVLEKDNATAGAARV